MRQCSLSCSSRLVCPAFHSSQICMKPGGREFLKLKLKSQHAQIYSAFSNFFIFATPALHCNCSCEIHLDNTLEKRKFQVDVCLTPSGFFWWTVRYPCMWFCTLVKCYSKKNLDTIIQAVIKKNLDTIIQIIIIQTLSIYIELVHKAVETAK